MLTIREMKCKHINLASALCIIISLSACASLPTRSTSIVPSGPDYADLRNWAAHPQKEDSSDKIPEQLNHDIQKELITDVFFVHPTTYTSKAIDGMWNAPVDNEKLNKKTDRGTIQYQASVFNNAGKVYAPRYRQAHLKTYYTKNEKLAREVFDQAYQDVKNAFIYYLENENDDRPFIIASHSQGTTHSVRLLKEMIDGKELSARMIAAYLIGMPVKKNSFDQIEPCKSKDDINCFVSWRTFKRGHIPSNVALGDSITVHNPLSWSDQAEYVSKDFHEGAILRNFDKIIPKATDAEVWNGILWASKPKFAFSFLFTRKNYHIADLNFYYVNVRQNAKHRADMFFSERTSD